MSTRVKINGQVINDRIEGIDKLTVTIKRKTKREELRKSFTTELVFHGDGYRLLSGILLGTGSGILSRAKIEVSDDCCNWLVFEGVIQADGIDFCTSDCWIKARVVQDDEETARLNCIQSTLIYDNTPNPAFPSGFQAARHPFIRYCLDIKPDILQYFILFEALVHQFDILILLPILFTITSIFLLIFAICNVINGIIWLMNLIVGVVNTLPGVSLGTMNSLNCSGFSPLVPIQLFLDWIDIFEDKIVGCGRFHPSPLARDYARNVCSKCGLSFSSNILNNPASPYYNSVYFTAPVEKGYNQTAAYPGVSFNLDNAPIHTLDTYLDELAIVFNADYEVRGATLFFERKDFFNPLTAWIDTRSEAVKLISGVCFKYKKDGLPAFLKIEMSKDSIDLSGNEAIDRFSDIIEWNSPPSLSQKGMLEKNLPIAPVRARLDGVDNDLFEFIAGFPNWQMFSFVPVIGSLNQWDQAILLPSHLAFTPKLLVWDGNSFDHGYVKRDYQTIATNYPAWNQTVAVPNSTAGGDLPPVGKRVNYPYFLHEGAPGTLYEEFHKIDNPRLNLPSSRKFDVTATVRLDCELLQSFDFSKGFGVLFRGNYVLAQINEIRVSFAKGEIEISAEV